MKELNTNQQCKKDFQKRFLSICQWDNMWKSWICNSNARRILKSDSYRFARNRRPSEHWRVLGCLFRGSTPKCKRNHKKKTAKSKRGMVQRRMAGRYKYEHYIGELHKKEEKRKSYPQEQQKTPYTKTD